MRGFVYGPIKGMEVNALFGLWARYVFREVETECKWYHYIIIIIIFIHFSANIYIL